MRHPIPKGKISKQRPKITKTRSNAALKTALDATAKAPLALDVYEAVLGLLSDYDAHVDDIARNLDPQSVADANNLSAARLDFTEKLDPALIKDFEKLIDCIGNVAFWREVASFYLGAAAAATLRNQFGRMS